jgi:hypothetical protein
VCVGKARIELIDLGTARFSPPVLSNIKLALNNLLGSNATAFWPCCQSQIKMYKTVPSVTCIIKNKIVNYISRVIRMMPLLAASLTIVILTTLEVSFLLLDLSIMLLEKICNTGVTHDDHHLWSSYFKVQATEVNFYISDAQEQ